MCCGSHGQQLQRATKHPKGLLGGGDEERGGGFHLSWEGRGEFGQIEFIAKYEDSVTSRKQKKYKGTEAGTFGMRDNSEAPLTI